MQQLLPKARGENRAFNPISTVPCLFLQQTCQVSQTFDSYTPHCLLYLFCITLFLFYSFYSFSLFTILILYSCNSYYTTVCLRCGQINYSHSFNYYDLGPLGLNENKADCLFAKLQYVSYVFLFKEHDVNLYNILILISLGNKSFPQYGQLLKHLYFNIVMLFLQCCRAQEKRPLSILGIFSVIIQYYTLLLVCRVSQFRF